MAAASLAAEKGLPITSMCTVFAESEVTGLVHRGEDRRAISRGLHESIAKRTLSSLGRVGAQGPKDMGKVMKELQPEVQGKAEGKAVSELVKQRLAKP